MSAGMRWGLVVLIVITTAIVSVVCTVSFVTWQPRPNVPLTTGLDGGWDTITSEFDTRVRTRFPIGLPEVDMTRELRREGFIREDWSYVVPEGGEAKATRREDRVVCRQAAYIYWRANPQGRLMSIRGVYRVEGCL